MAEGGEEEYVTLMDLVGVNDKKALNKDALRILAYVIRWMKVWLIEYQFCRRLCAQV